MKSGEQSDNISEALERKLSKLGSSSMTPAENSEIRAQIFYQGITSGTVGVSGQELESIFLEVVDLSQQGLLNPSWIRLFADIMPRELAVTDGATDEEEVYQAVSTAATDESYGAHNASSAADADAGHTIIGQIVGALSNIHFGGFS